MIHSFDPNARRTACGIRAWPYGHQINKAQKADRSLIDVATSAIAPTCKTCLAVVARREMEKRHGR